MCKPGNLKKWLRYVVQQTGASRVLLLSVMGIVSGCMPLSLTYWEPAAQGGKIANSVSGTVGYNDMAEFSFNHVAVRFIGGGSWLSIALLVPEGTSASFLSDKIELYEGRASKSTVKFDMFCWDTTTMQKVHISPTSLMLGANTSVAILGGAQPKQYNSSVNLEGAKRQHYSIKPPSIRVGNQVFDFPLIEFDKKEGFGIGPIN